MLPVLSFINSTISVLYMIYYILMFTAFLPLRYDQPNRPRSFKDPGGKVGAWIVAGLGLVSSAFAIVLAIYPPAQVKSEVGSPIIYISVILSLLAVVLVICFNVYQLSKKHPNWVNPHNKFAPFTWEIEGLTNARKSFVIRSYHPLCLKITTLWGCQLSVPYKPDQQVSNNIVKEDENNEISTSKIEYIRDF